MFALRCTPYITDHYEKQKFSVTIEKQEYVCWKLSTKISYSFISDMQNKYLITIVVPEFYIFDINDHDLFTKLKLTSNSETIIERTTIHSDVTADNEHDMLFIAYTKIMSGMLKLANSVLHTGIKPPKLHGDLPQNYSTLIENIWPELNTINYIPKRDIEPCVRKKYSCKLELHYLESYTKEESVTIGDVAHVSWKVYVSLIYKISSTIGYNKEINIVVPRFYIFYTNDNELFKKLKSATNYSETSKEQNLITVTEQSTIYTYDIEECFLKIAESLILKLSEIAERAPLHTTIQCPHLDNKLPKRYKSLTKEEWLSINGNNSILKHQTIECKYTFFGGEGECYKKRKDMVINGSSHVCWEVRQKIIVRRTESYSNQGIYDTWLNILVPPFYVFAENDAQLFNTLGMTQDYQMALEEKSIRLGQLNEQIKLTTNNINTEKNKEQIKILSKRLAGFEQKKIKLTLPPSHILRRREEINILYSELTSLETSLLETPIAIDDELIEMRKGIYERQKKLQEKILKKSKTFTTTNRTEGCRKLYHYLIKRMSLIAKNVLHTEIPYPTGYNRSDCQKTTLESWNSFDNKEKLITGIQAPNQEYKFWLDPELPDDRADHLDSDDAMYEVTLEEDERHKVNYQGSQEQLNDIKEMINYTKNKLKKYKEKVKKHTKREDEQEISYYSEQIGSLEQRLSSLYEFQKERMSALRAKSSRK